MSKKGRVTGKSRQMTRMPDESELTRDNWCRDFHGGNLGRYFNFETDQRYLATTYNHKNADKLVLNVGSSTKDFRYKGGHIKLWCRNVSK